jgi:hypothetical protein
MKGPAGGFVRPKGSAYVVKFETSHESAFFSSSSRWESLDEDLKEVG